MDFIFANSYIVVNGSKILLEESYYDLKEKMNDSNDTITVHVLDFIGIFSDTKTFSKSSISDYGSY